MNKTNIILTSLLGVFIIGIGVTGYKLYEDGFTFKEAKSALVETFNIDTEKDITKKTELTLDEADEIYFKAKYDKAIKVYEANLSRLSKEQKLRLAESYNHNKQYDKSIETYETLHSEGAIYIDELIEKYLTSTQKYIENGEGFKASELYKKAITLSRNGPLELKVKESFILFAINHNSLEDAITAYGMLLDLKHKNTKLSISEREINLMLGDLSSGIGEYTKAFNHYNENTKLNPTDYESYTRLGHTYFDLEDYDKAIELYRKTLSLNGNEWEALMGVADSYYELGKKQEAVNWYKKVAAIKQDNAYLFFKLGKAQQELGYKREAIENYSKAIQVNPEGPSAKEAKRLMDEINDKLITEKE